MKPDRMHDLDELIGNGKSPKIAKSGAKQSQLVPSGLKQPQSVIKAELTTTEAAKFFGVTPRTVQQLITRGVFTPLPSGRLDTRDTVRAYIAAVRKGTGSTLEAAKIRVAEEQAAKLTLQNAAARRELLPAGEVEREWSNALRDLRAALLALPSRLQQRLPHLTAHDIAAFDREIRDILTELAGDD